MKRRPYRLRALHGERRGGALSRRRSRGAGGCWGRPLAVLIIRTNAERTSELSPLAVSPKGETLGGTMATITVNQRKQRAAVFKALGHPARLRIVEELLRAERCVCELVEVSEGGWSTVSRHLSVLKSAGVVEDEKRGLQVYYRLALPCVGTFLDCLAGGGSATAMAVSTKACGCR